MYGFNPYQQYAPRYELMKVNGEAGARQFPISAGSVLLLDENEPIIWFVQCDGLCKNVTPYRISPVKQEERPSNLEERIKRIEEMLNESHTFSNDVNTVERNVEQSGTASEHTSKQKSGRFI